MSTAKIVPSDQSSNATSDRPSSVRTDSWTGGPLAEPNRLTVVLQVPSIRGPGRQMNQFDGTTSIGMTYDTLASQIEAQQDALKKMMDTQRTIEEKHQRTVDEDTRAIQERFQVLKNRLLNQGNTLKELQMQQEQILKILNIQEKVSEQDRQLRAFFDYQRNFMSTLQAPMQTQSSAMENLQANQAYLINSLSSINMSRAPDLPPSIAATQGGQEVLQQGLPKDPNDPDAREGIFKRKHEGQNVANTDARYQDEMAVLGGLKPTSNHDPDIDAKHLRKAMRGLGTNEKTLINVLGSRTQKQRQAIAQAFNINYKRDLLKDLRSETSGNFKQLLTAIMHAPPTYDALEVHKAIKGLGTNDSALIEILCTRTNAEINAMKEAYQAVLSRDVMTDVMGDVSGNYKNLLKAILEGDRDESTTIDRARAKEDASRLYAAGEAKMGTDEKVFIEVMTKRSRPQLRATMEEYEKLDEFELEQTIKRETSGRFKDGLVLMAKYVKSRHNTFAELLYKSMKGLGTRDNALIRLMVSRSEIDLKDIAAAFKIKYQTSLEHWVKSDTSGNYRKLLLELLYGEVEFNPEKDSKDLRKAMKGWGARKRSMNKILAYRTNAQRQIVRETYDAMYKRNLIKDLKSELLGNHEHLAIALMTPPIELAAAEIQRAIKGLGTDDSSLIELLVSHSFTQLQQIKEAYQRLFNRDMVSDIKGDTSGSYEKLLVALVDTERDDHEPVDEALALEEASQFYAAGEAKRGTDEATFIRILSSHGRAMLRSIFEQYAKLCDYDVEKSITRETSYNFKHALVSIVQVVRNPQEYFARRLHKTMKGLGTQDRNLIRIMAMRSEYDLKHIGDAFFKLFKVTLDVRLSGETSGHYKKLLLFILDRARRTKSKYEEELAAQSSTRTVDHVRPGIAMRPLVQEPSMMRDRPLDTDERPEYTAHQPNLNKPKAAGPATVTVQLDQGKTPQQAQGGRPQQTSQKSGQNATPQKPGMTLAPGKGTTPLRDREAPT